MEFKLSSFHLLIYSILFFDFAKNINVCFQYKAVKLSYLNSIWSILFKIQFQHGFVFKDFSEWLSSCYQQFKLIINNSLQSVIYVLTSQMDNPLFNHWVEIDQALFFAISRDDYQNAQQLVLAGSNPNAIFLLEKGVYISSFNLFINKAAQIGKSKGPTNNQYISCFKLLKTMIKGKGKPPTLECKCTKEHKCPLYTALEAFKISDEDQLLNCKCDLVRYLIQNGATIKYQQDQDKKALKNPGKWNLKWLDIDGIRNYLITKNFNYVQTKIQK